MAQAKVTSTDAIRLFRVAMIKFAESVSAALGNADSDVNRAQSWLDMEAKPYWASEIRKRQVALAQAQEKLRMKTLYKNFDGTTPSAVDEKKAVDVAKRRLEIAEQKAANVRKYATIMTRETVLYKGSVTRFATTIQSGVPVAIAHLARVMMAIERYLAANPEVANISSAGAGESSGPGYMELLQSMSRPAEEEPALNESAGGVTEEEAGSGSRVPGSLEDAAPLAAAELESSNPEPQTPNPEPESP